MNRTINFFRAVIHTLWLLITVIPWALVVVVFSMVGSSTAIYWLCAGWLRLAVMPMARGLRWPSWI